jgi:hypothetical protein
LLKQASQFGEGSDLIIDPSDRPGQFRTQSKRIAGGAQKRTNILQREPRRATLGDGAQSH